ncbi:fimbrial protein [Lelliottia sp. CFBP8978]|uniref:fimbrial protein n=1 Tax=Lelliottia sp. CFBP8978 TaxID=3096522 RepID=UPI002A6AB46B|nr:fimbrial protein [Lelliottia sp. CFBP8978]MDY1038404.1 fimbrial protein [Lelliottia sp. CFBP8978]
MKKFNKSILLASLAASILLPGVSNAATDNIVPLTISGAIVNSTNCSVSVKPSIDLENVVDSQIKTSDQTPTVFTGETHIVFENCGSEKTTFALSLQGTPDATDSTLLANNAQTGSASNVGIGVWTYPYYNQLTVGGASQTFVKDTDIPDMNVGLVVAMAKADGSKEIEPGQVSSTAQFKIDYL